MGMEDRVLMNLCPGLMLSILVGVPLRASAARASFKCTLYSVLFRR